MSIDLPLESMTTSQKLEVIEAVWASICNKPSEVESPEWHAAILAERRRRLQAGEASVGDWESAKSRIQQHGQ